MGNRADLEAELDRLQREIDSLRPTARQADARQRERMKRWRNVACPDGELRIFTGEPTVSPYHNARDPLYAWRVDPGDFSVSDRRVVYDSVAAGMLKVDCVPRLDMCKLVPHSGGRTQTVLFRIRVKNVNHQYGSLPPITPELKAKCAVYRAEITYSEDIPATWNLGG